MRLRKAVMQRIANPSRRFDSDLSLQIYFKMRKIRTINSKCPGGGIGRHKGLKIPRRKLRAGSSPAPAPLPDLSAT